MIDVYTGEFLINPIALELSYNHCSHGCLYCFASLNGFNKPCNYETLISQIKECYDRKSLACQLLTAGYPVTLSNRTDPFCNANYKITRGLLEVMVNYGKQVFIQTKGGKGIDDVLSFLPKSVWYISVTSDKDSKRIEPGAPTIAERLELIRKLIAKQHVVVVGINPCIKEFVGDYVSLIEKLKALGVWGCWLEKLHLNRSQIRNMSDRSKEIIGEEIIGRATGRITSENEFAFLMDVSNCIMDSGLQLFSAGQPLRSNFFDPFYQIYKCLPTIQNFVNWCFDNNVDYELLSIDDFFEHAGGFLPEGIFKNDCYIHAVSRNICRYDFIPGEMTYKHMTSIIWRDLRHMRSLVNMRCFSFVKEKIDGEYRQLVDDREIPYIVFSRNGFTDYYHDAT